MTHPLTSTTRRRFLQTSLFGGLALSSSPALAALQREKTKVAVTAGEDRADNIFQALRPFADQVKAAIGDRRVILKPNNVSITRQLSATHAQALEGTLEFMKSIGVKNIAIAESAAAGSTMDGFEEYGYLPLAEKYGAKLMNLDEEGHEILYVIHEDSGDELHPVRVSKVMLNHKDNFIVSNAVMKTHDRVVTTLSLKNIIFGAPIKDKGFAWGSSRKPGTTNDKPIAHGGNGCYVINDNMRKLAKRLYPELAVIDGYEGMEGNGPVGGDPVEHRVAVASMDWLAADRTAAEMMGIDFAIIGYLNYCYQDGMGEADMRKMDFIGEDPKEHVRKYKLSSKIERQLRWMQQG